MTLLNLYVEPDRADLYTDGAIMHADGRVSRFASKAVILGHLPVALSVSGMSDLNMRAQLALHDKFCSVDELNNGAVEALRAVREFRDPVMPYIVVWAGYSEQRGRVVGHFLAPMSVNGAPPWQRQEVWRTIAPNPAALAVRLAADGLDMMRPEPIADHEALQAVEAQCEMREPFADAGPVCRVGGFCQHTRITREGVFTQIARRWPDAIGLLLDTPYRTPGSRRDPFRDRAPEPAARFCMHNMGAPDPLPEAPPPQQPVTPSMPRMLGTRGTGPGRPPKAAA